MQTKLRIRFIDNIENIACVLLVASLDSLGCLTLQDEDGNEAYLQDGNDQRELVDDCFAYAPDEGYEPGERFDVIEELEKGWDVHIRMGIDTWHSYLEAFGE